MYIEMYAYLAESFHLTKDVMWQIYYADYELSNEVCGERESVCVWQINYADYEFSNEVCGERESVRVRVRSRVCVLACECRFSHLKPFVLQEPSPMEWFVHEICTHIHT